MVIHRKNFRIVNNLHDLTCKGIMNYKQALGSVQDFNLMKELSTRMSFPDLKGNRRDSQVDMNVLQNLFFDLDLFNYIDVIFRKKKMGRL